jgi:hypothetical protein
LAPKELLFLSNMKNKHNYAKIERMLLDLAVVSTIVGCAVQPLAKPAYELMEPRPKYGIVEATKNPGRNQLRDLDSLSLDSLSFDNIKIKRIPISYADGDIERVAEVIFTEAGICEEIEQIAVAYTIVNRKLSSKKHYGETLSKITSPRIYNGMYNSEDILELKRIYPERWYHFTQLAKKVLNQEVEDPTHGATHFYKPSKYHQNPITWNMSKMEELGKIKISEDKLSRHKFYRETD